MSRSLLRSIYLKLGRFILVNQQIVDFSKSIDGFNQCVVVFGEMESNIIVVSSLKNDEPGTGVTPIF